MSSISDSGHHIPIPGTPVWPFSSTLGIHQDYDRDQMLVHVMGINLCQYLDDWLIYSPSHDQCLRDTVHMLNLCHMMGLLIHDKKSELIPKQKFLFLGYQCDLVSFHHKSSTDLLIPVKPRRMCSYVADPVRSLCIHRENGSSGMAAHPRSPTLHLSTLGFQCFNQQLVDTSFPHGGGRFPMVEISTQWSEGAPVTPTKPDTQLFTDASNIDWGAHWNALTVSGVWTTTEKTLHINVFELEAIHRAMAAEAYGSDSPGCVRQLHCSVLHQQAGRNTVNTAVQTDQEATPHVSGQPNSTLGMTHPREIERPCRHSVTPFPGVRYRMVSTSICLPSTDTGMGNPIIRSVCNKVESQTSTICVPCSRSISHGSRCSVNELEGTVGTRIPTTSSVITGA